MSRLLRPYATLATVLLACMLVPATAGAELASPLGGLSPTPEEQEEIKASETSKSASAATTSGSSTSAPGTLVFAGIAAAVLLGGIAFLIVRDARGVAPAGEGPAGGLSASARRAQLRRRRARAKAARRQRKRNR
jgi:hypothetical protein